MKLTRELGAPEDHRIRGYEPGRIFVNEEAIETSVLVAGPVLDREWPPASFEDLSPEHLDAVIALDPEIVLLGTGERQRFPRREFMRVMFEKGIGLEVMDTASACRTYHVLMAEGRMVVAALLP
ncbi:Mth938-like domain-containing protein [Ectothiorhodospiraceae bacterium WFHF3C12]|nr:Mth938-like domain-containing protein [Ectothiorhodospiraceae bacterium WFHF3C12]